jgi:hypothetical protein
MHVVTSTLFKTADTRMMVRLLYLTCFALLSSWTVSAAIGTQTVVWTWWSLFHRQLLADPANFGGSWNFTLLGVDAKELAPFRTLSLNSRGSTWPLEDWCTTNKNYDRHGSGLSDHQILADGDVYDYPGNRDEASFLYFSQR